MPLWGEQAKVPLRESRPEGAITCQPRATPWGSSYHRPAGEYALTAEFGLSSAKLRQKVSGTDWHFWESFQFQLALGGAGAAQAQVDGLVGFRIWAASPRGRGDDEESHVLSPQCGGRDKSLPSPLTLHQPRAQPRLHFVMPEATFRRKIECARL
jgi:hypothetical protein